jgi:hypothetical protein
MATFCYTWDNADVFWNTVELTWAEFCVVDKAIGVVGGGSNRRLKKELTDEEQQTIIDLLGQLEAKYTPAEIKMMGGNK